MVPTRQGVLVVAAAAAAAAVAAAADVAVVAAVDASAVAAVARGFVKPTAADTARGAAKPTTAVDDDDADGLCRCIRREHCCGFRGPVEPRRHAPGRHLVALHLWSGHGCRRHFRRSSSSPRSEPGLPPLHQGQCLSSSKTFFSRRRKQREGHSAFDGQFISWLY